MKGIWTKQQEDIFAAGYKLGVMETERDLSRKLYDVGGSVNAIAYLLGSTDDYVRQYLTADEK